MLSAGLCSFIISLIIFWCLITSVASFWEHWWLLNVIYVSMETVNSQRSKRLPPANLTVWQMIMLSFQIAFLLNLLYLKGHDSLTFSLIHPKVFNSKHPASCSTDQIQNDSAVWLSKHDLFSRIGFDLFERPRTIEDGLKPGTSMTRDKALLFPTSFSPNTWSNTWRSQR